MKRKLANVVNQWLVPFGVEIIKKNNSVNLMPTWENRLSHAQSIGFAPKQIIDAGAFKGFWTKSAFKIFPGSQIVTIEPNPHIEAELKKNLSNIMPHPIIIQRGVGETPGESQFNIWGDPKTAMSASLQSHVQGEAKIKVNIKVDTLDNIAKEYNIQPDLVKLDLQGSELKALKGATSLLQTVEMFMIEFGCLDAYLNRATPRDIMDVFFDNDYCLYDIVDLHYRPYDGALTGGDFIFVKNSSPLRAYKNWN
ncbi:FkbM family methyltransferase [Cyanothece sp. BG0011]|uniref:FkbM family methyltransferase n=1 Tax=Cyanothece sp. BG0011 TaxID=2082950 RepID=UPI000D1DF8D6|nr:FkbM family methyltransferase [Cyanothece sp. BG0011]